MIEDKDKSKKGFSGLVDLVSDISIVESINDNELKGFASTSKESSSKYEVINSDDNSKKQKGSNPLIWGLWIITIIICLIWLTNSGQSPQKPSYVQTPSPVRVPSPPISHRGNPASVNVTPNNASSSQLQYEKPPVGTNNTLNISQLRWHFRESIRLETMRDLIYTNDAIDAFNRLVDDYNRRCASFRYQESDFRRAEREVEARRSEITAEAIRDARLLGYVPERPKVTPQIGYISGNNVFLRPVVSKREGPFLKLNDKVTIIRDAAETYDNRIWSYIEHNGRKGWVSKEYISEKPVDPEIWRKQEEERKSAERQKR